jgi:hypothetical protein
MTCADCIVDTDLLRSILTRALHNEVPEISTVVLEDPRADLSKL